MSDTIPTSAVTPNSPGSAERAGSADTGHAELLEEILADVAAGDAAAFELFFATTWGHVRARAAAVVHDPAIADEVAQEVLVEVWRSAARYDALRGTAMSWLMTLTQRRATDRMRLQPGDAGDPWGEAAAGPPFSMHPEERVRDGLACLSPLQLQAITMAFYGGQSAREVADQLGVPLSISRSRIRDGLQRLARAVDVREPAPPLARRA